METSASRPVLQPGPDHRISITPTGRRVVVRVEDLLVADSADALTLREAGCPPVQYIPMADVKADLAGPTSTASYCPYKGDCSYYSISTPDGEIADGAWSYPEPYPAVSDIAGHLAFYPGTFTIIVG